MHVCKRVLKAYPLFIETLEGGLHVVTCSMPENTIVNQEMLLYALLKLMFIIQLQ